MSIFKNPIKNPLYKGVLDITPAELLAHKSDVRIIDVRRPDEYIGELGHIQGAELIVLDTLPQQIEELPKDETIVFICRSGNRSGQAAAYAMENGIKSVFNMKGGMIAWNEQGFEISTEEE